MTLEVSLLELVLADGGVAAVFGSRVWWVRAPQAELRDPYVVLTRIGGGREIHLGGAAGLELAAVQADVRAVTYDQVVAGRRALVAALSAYQGAALTGIFVEAERDLPDATAAGAPLYRKTLDLSVWGPSNATSPGGGSGAATKPAEHGLLDVLLADSGVATELGRRIWWIRAPQVELAEPYAVMRRTAGDRARHLAGAAGLEAAGVEIEVRAPSYAEAVTASRAISGALAGYRDADLKGVIVDAVRDLPDATHEGEPLYRRSIGLTVWGWEI